MPVIYKCLRCGKEFTPEEMAIIPGVRCPYCSYRILVKIRPKGTVKQVRAI